MTTETFNYTGAEQTWVVPTGVTSVTVDVQGGEGGLAGEVTTARGQGGRVEATLAVTPGETLYVYVGGAGANGGGSVSSGGFNGGGQGGVNAGAGGGASDIRQGGNALANRKVVAGGGGAAGGNWGSGGTTSGGGDGGGTTGVAGTNGGGTNFGRAGGAGTGAAGGAAGTGGPGIDGAAGSSGTGGTGGNDGVARSGGGGGGGYFGGGGGEAATTGGSGGGGGGGSSFTHATDVTGVTHTQGHRSGNGIVTVTYTPPTVSKVYPNADSVDGGWTNESGNNTNLYASLDETSADDNDYIQGAAGVSGDSVTLLLGDATDPNLSTGHILRYRYLKSGDGTVDALVELLQGASTVIASQTHTAISSTVTPGSFTLSGSQADAITDYADLRVRFTQTISA